MVFEVTGSIQNFANSVANIRGLEFAGEEELTPDDLDDNPEFYLLVPQLEALHQIVSLWETWERTGALPHGFAPWRNLFHQLRRVRPWGPADRVSEQNRERFRDIIDGAPDNEPVRIEIELVFRPSPQTSHTSEAALRDQIIQSGGSIVDRARRAEFGYHAVLADVPAAEIRRIVELDPASLVGADPVASIVPQSVGTPIEVADHAPLDTTRPHPELDEPIVAVFDAVPIQAHPLLAGQLTIDDPNNLESLAVGQRVHGTAMASLALHGDLNDPPTPIRRRLYFRPVMYAPAFGSEVFQNDRLVVDVIVEAITRMRAGVGPNVIVVNLSLGDSTKPFAGKVSTWARALDYLAFTYGILFLVSAGNVADAFPLTGFADAAAFQVASPADRSAEVLRALDAVKADRRILAPGDSLNALTIGAWHRDSVELAFPGATPFTPFHAGEMPNLTSRLGPGLSRGTKPEGLFAGGRQRARLHPTAAPPVLQSHAHPSRFWGLKVAAPPEGGGEPGQHFTIGTSGATALATHTAHRIFDAIEEAYPNLIDMMPLAERACLMKTLLIHAASWRGSDTFIRSVIDPDEQLHHEHWRREVCRHLGYGFVDPEDAIACASDRATMWATGAISSEGSITFEVPIPDVFAQSAAPREVRATLAWFAPVRPGHLAYRAVKLRIPALQDDSLHAAGVDTYSGQPTNSQSESGTIVHRRWHAERIGGLGSRGTIPVQVQRENDQGTPIDEAIPFGLAVTVEMPGALEVYEQVAAGIAVRPRPRIRS